MGYYVMEIKLKKPSKNGSRSVLLEDEYLFEVNILRKSNKVGNERADLLIFSPNTLTIHNEMNDCIMFEYSDSDESRKEESFVSGINPHR